MLFFCLLFPLLGEILTLKCSAFKIEELQSVMYEVNLSKIPLKHFEESNLLVMLMTSSSGEDYQCQLPPIEEERMPGKVRTSVKSVNMKKLLMPLYEGNCLYKIKDWWTYEICFGKGIRQFHIEEGKITGEILTLGVYESDYEWENNDKEDFKHHAYHPQFYYNGTKCDLTGLPRTAEVRIFCEEDSLDYIDWIDEPSTCNYVIAVHTSHVCSHPLLKLTKKAYTIPCHPLLIDETDVNHLDNNYLGGYSSGKNE